MCYLTNHIKKKVQKQDMNKTNLIFEDIKRDDVIIDPRLLTELEYLHNYIEINDPENKLNIIITQSLVDRNLEYENLKTLFGEKKLIKLLNKFGIFYKFERVILINITLKENKYSFAFPVTLFEHQTKKGIYIQKFKTTKSNYTFIEYNFNEQGFLDFFSLNLSTEVIKINAHFKSLVTGFSSGKDGISSTSEAGRIFGGKIIAPYCKVDHKTIFNGKKIESNSSSGYHDRTIGPLTEAGKEWYWTKSSPNNEYENEVISLAHVVNQPEFSKNGDIFQYFFKSKISSLQKSNPKKITDKFEFEVLKYNKKVPEYLLINALNNNYFIHNYAVIEEYQGYTRMKSNISMISQETYQDIITNLSKIWSKDFKILSMFDATSEFLNMPSIKDDFIGNFLRKEIKRKIIKNNIFAGIQKTNQYIESMTIPESVRKDLNLTDEEIEKVIFSEKV